MPALGCEPRRGSAHMDRKRASNRREKGWQPPGCPGTARTELAQRTGPEKITRGRWTNRDERVKRYLGTWAVRVAIANSRDFRVELRDGDWSSVSGQQDSRGHPSEV